MELTKSDAPKLADMVMCGDHPSFTKTELNVKTDSKMDVKAKEKAKDKIMSYAKITPTASRTERIDRGERTERTELTEARELHTAELAVRSAARRRVRSLEVLQRTDVGVTSAPTRALVHAALGSFRWPPYLLCVWVLVLALTHALHCVVSLLERALPALRRFSQCVSTWTVSAWRAERESRVYPVALAALTALSYALYFALYVLHAAALWAVEPLTEPEQHNGQLAATADHDEDYQTNSTGKP